MKHTKQKKVLIADDNYSGTHNTTANSKGVVILQLSNSDIQESLKNQSNMQLNQKSQSNRYQKKKDKKVLGEQISKIAQINYVEKIDLHLDEANQMQKNRLFSRAGAESPEFRNDYDTSFKPKIQQKQPDVKQKKRKTKNIESSQEKKANTSRQTQSKNQPNFTPFVNMQIIESSMSKLPSKSKAIMPMNSSIKNILQIQQDEMTNNSMTAIKSAFQVFSFNREKKCYFNQSNSKYHIDINSASYTITSLKASSCFNSHYKIHVAQKGNFLKNPKQIGQLVSNFTGSQFNLYCQNQHGLEELVATIIYNIQCRFSSLRKMEVFIKNQGMTYEEVRGNHKEGTNLKIIYQDKQTQNGYIRKLITKQPKWREDLQCYIQNFKRKSKMPSSKNIILVEQSNQSRDCLLFCKRSNNEFYGEMSYPLSPFTTMGLLLSMFDFKLLCQ